MPRIAFLIIVLVVIVGALFFLSTVPKEQPTHTIEVEVPQPGPRAECALSRLLIASAALVLALPAIAQEVAQTQPAPSGAAPATTAIRRRQSPQPTAVRGNASDAGAADESAVEEVSNISLPPPPPPVEYPGWARRDPRMSDSLTRRSLGLATIPGARPAGLFFRACCGGWTCRSRRAGRTWRSAMRCSPRRAPVQLNPVDWVAERAWLLLRMGEADAARMLVAGVDTDLFTPKMIAGGRAERARKCRSAGALPTWRTASANTIRISARWCRRCAHRSRGSRKRRPRKSTMPAAAAASAVSTWRWRKRWLALRVPAARRRSNGTPSTV